MLNDKNQKRLETLLSAFDSGAVQPNELIEAMEAVMVIIKHSEKLFLSQIKDTSETSMRSMTSLKAEIAQAHRDIQILIKDAKENSTTETATLRRLVAQEVKRLEESMPIMPDEFDATEIQKSLEEHTELLAKISELISGENIRNALESLPDGEKQSIDSIQDLREELDKRQAEERGHTTAIIARRLDQILDVSIAGVTNGQVLTYNSTTKTWGAGSGGGGYTNLTSFVDQTAHRVFYSNDSGDVTELALGADGTFLKSNGASSAPSFAVPAGSGDMVLATVQTNTGAKTFLATTLLLRNVAGTFNGSFTNTNTADRIYTLQNRAGTLADDTDLALKANLASPTFTGTVVLPSGQALIAPALGTPASGVMTNVTGTASGLTAGNATTLATARTIAGQSFNGSANIAIAATNLSDTALLARLASPTFTGTVVLPNSQALVTPVLGTPTSVTLTNATGLPISGLVNSTSAALGLGTVELGHATDTTLSRSSAGVLAVEGVVVPTISSTSTFTNKRVNPRTNSTTTAATLAPDLTVANVYFRTTQTATLTISAPIGTPVIGETLYIEVSSVAAQTLTINATYIPFGAAFPATTTAGKSFLMTCTFNGTNWRTTWASEI